MKIEQVHWDNATKIKELTCGILAGSVHVSIYEANDIDIVVSAEQWRYARSNFDWSEFNLVQSDLENDDTYEVEIHELMEVWSCGKVNILVYNPDFIPAIKAAVRDMKRWPEQFQTRELRIELHQKYKDIIRSMINPDYEDVGTTEDY